MSAPTPPKPVRPSPSAAGAPARKAAPRAAAKRGQGQWALGYREPLNPNERTKRDSDGLAVRQRIEDIYSKGGFASIDPADLRGRFRWYGLYTQRAPGIPGGRTAVLEPEELEDEYFMLRIRIDGGRLSAGQLQVIADISTTYGRDVADITDRQNVQLHWIRVEDMPAIWEKVEAVGLSTTEACGDTPRVMLVLPARGRDGGRGRQRPAGGARDRRQVPRRPGLLEPAPQVQDVDLRVHAALHEPRDQRHLLRRCR